MTRWFLRTDVHLKVLYDDRTPFGAAVGARCDDLVRELFAPVIEHARARGFASLDAHGPRLLAEVIEGEQFPLIAEGDGAGAWRLRDELLYPDPARSPPRELYLACEPLDRLLPVEPGDAWPELHALLARLSGEGLARDEPLPPFSRALLDRLGRDGLLDDDPGPGPQAALADAELLFLGHNTALLRPGDAALLVDPFLSARLPDYPRAYQPLQRRELGPVDAIALTHAHPDHFDPASLLRFPPDTRIITPRIAREHVLAVDMARRLRELGFTNVTSLGWGEATTVGDVELRALPLYGEQPTDHRALHPELRNHGNTYVVRGPRFSAALLADSGRDGLGDVRDLAIDARREFGPVDVVLTGYRGWQMYPVQHIFSSVARYVLFVPPWLWGTRQQLMTTPEGAIDVAERFGARYVIPYADGGAPWHWRVGLGPVLDGRGVETRGFDLFPERVVDAAVDRSQALDGGGMRSPVRPLLVRPNEAVRGLAGAAEVLALPGNAWPYAGACAQRREAPARA